VGLRGLAFAVVLVGLWELACRTGVLDPDFVSSPSRIVTTLAHLLTTASFWTVDVAATGRGFLAGWSAAVVLGVGFGTLMGLSGPVRDLLEPAVAALYVTPRIALVPLFVVWFGFGFDYKLVVVFVASIFSVLLNTVAGVREADRQLVRMSRSFGARRAQVVLTVVLPGARPAILTGIRQSVTHGLVGVVIGEMFSSQDGVGYLIYQAAQLGLVDQLCALVTLLAVVGAGLNHGLLRAQARLDRWRGADQFTSTVDGQL
jgi:NitT/TauT family transport system permease protein